MKIDVYSSAGAKTGTMELPASLFEARVNQGLMHQAVVRQQSNRRVPAAHVKNRGEVAGSTSKLYAQKHTGRARRGSIRSPLLRGGGKAFGPRSNANFIKNMPREMYKAAIRSCLSFQAKKGAIIGLQSYPDTVKTKEFFALLKKLPVEFGRRILFVLPEKHKSLMLSSRNVPRIKTTLASYLNPEDVLVSRHIVFVEGSVERLEAVFGKRKERIRKVEEVKAEASEKKAEKPKAKSKVKSEAKPASKPKAAKTKRSKASTSSAS